MREPATDSLAVLLEIGCSVNQNAERVMTLAEQRGARVEADKVRVPLQKLFDCSGLAERTLAGVPANTLVATNAG